MKYIFLFVMWLYCLAGGAQNQVEDSKYLEGAVPVINGYVQFDAKYKVKGKSRNQIMGDIQQYVQSVLVEGEEQLPQARLTQVTPEDGVIAASIEEYMYFKRTKWQIHRVRFYYQLVFDVKDEGFSVSMKRLHYKYDPEVTAGDFDEDRKAEKWITDEAALIKNRKKLARISGKFRKHTIDRKNEIFKGVANACGAIGKKMKLVEVEE